MSTTEETIAKLVARTEKLEAELKTKEAVIESLLRRLYGAKSEKLDADQLLLAFLQEEAPKKPEAAGSGEDEPAAEDTKRTKKPRTQKLRNSLQGLPTHTTEILPEEVLAEPESYRRIGEQRSERLEISPAALTLHITVRPTFVRKGDPEAAPTTAALPTPLLENSVLSPSLGAHLLTEKFCYHQPFARHPRHRNQPQRHVRLARPPRRPPSTNLRTHRHPDEGKRLPQSRRDPD